ncbi:MAG: thioredoxin [Propionibacteriales bacterium]|nr:thioredoxin [Propionibacteriales bacterium]
MSPGWWVLVAAVAVAVLLGLAKQWHDGRFRRGRRAVADDSGDRLTPAEIGAELGGQATLLQISSAFCAPCRATRHLLGHVADQVDGVRHVEIDAESHLDLVRRLGVMRTPTVLVLDAAGRITTRASGLPRRHDVVAALGRAIPERQPAD